jgi:uncharacterized protein with ParB-like and HNH nuclease domain
MELGDAPMDTDDLKIELVLKESRRFMVPLYQRKYQWAEHRLLPFWEDVQAKTIEVLNGESKFEHYMGALILAPVDIGSQFNKTPIVQVVDGQQRLTTFQLFLVSLREVARRHGLLEFIENVNEYLFNEPKSRDKDPLTRFKLNPTPSDRPLFHDLLDLEYAEVLKKHKGLFWGFTVPKNTPFPAFRAYILFNRWIEEFVVNGPSEDEPLIDDDAKEDEIEPDVSGQAELVNERLEALLNAVLERLKLVVISLGEQDDAQVIFETLNSKGEPLLAMDLVRNNIFHRAEKQEAEVDDLYARLWDPLDHSWWREDAPNARPKRPRIDHFLAHTLAAETGAKISMRELYAEYRSFALPKNKPRFEKVEDELKLLQEFMPLYETLEGRKSENSTLHWLGRKMAAWQVTTIYPVAMQLGKETVSEAVASEIANLLYSYIVRRALCDLTTKNLNNVFQGIAAKFCEEGVSVMALYEFFKSKSGDSIRFPANEELTAGILSKNAYTIAPQPRLVDILWELEAATRSKFSEIYDRPQGLWIEHVLPQSWTEDWPFDKKIDFAGPNSSEPQAVERRNLANSLGNLTLLTSSLNQSVGKQSFKTKKAKYAEHTGLFLNKWFAHRQKWDEADIIDRGKQLASLAVVIWPDLGDGTEN